MSATRPDQTDKPHADFEKRIRVVIVDDHPIFRGGVALTLAEEPDFDLVGQGASADDAVALVTDHMPDLALIDISMPGGGVSAAARIGSSFPAVSVVMLTASEDDDDVMNALKAGASGYILKGVGATELITVLRSIANGESYVAPSLAAKLLTAMRHTGANSPGNPVDALSAREEQILRLVAQGLSNKEIGRDLDLQEKTVKHYMTNILQKLHVRNRVEAALLAREHGI